MGFALLNPSTDLTHLRAQFARELVFRAAGRANRRVDDDMLSRSHARGNDRRAIAADVIGAAIAAEERSNVRRRMVVSGRGRRIYHFERNTGHIKSYLDAICRWPVEDVLYRTLVSGRYGSMPAAGRFGARTRTVMSQPAPSPVSCRRQVKSTQLPGVSAAVSSTATWKPRPVSLVGVSASASQPSRPQWTIAGWGRATASRAPAAKPPIGACGHQNACCAATRWPR